VLLCTPVLATTTLANHPEVNRWFDHELAERGKGVVLFFSGWRLRADPDWDSKTAKLPRSRDNQLDRRVLTTPEPERTAPAEPAELLVWDVGTSNGKRAIPAASYQAA